MTTERYDSNVGLNKELTTDEEEEEVFYQKNSYQQGPDILPMRVPKIGYVFPLLLHIIFITPKYISSANSVLYFIIINSRLL